MRTALAPQERPKAADRMEITEPAAERPPERIPITKARPIIGKLVSRVHVEKERIVLEKGGMPVAALIDIEEFKEFLAYQEAKETGKLTK